MEVLQRYEDYWEKSTKEMTVLTELPLLLPSQPLLLVWKVVSRLQVQVDPFGSSFHVISSYHVSPLSF